MKQQTTLDWYWDKIKSHFEHDGDLFETACFTYAIAKEMEKEQIIDAHIEGQRVFDKHPHTQWTNDQAEQYYNETYGSDELGSSLEWNGKVTQGHTIPTSSQTEISDEEIERAAYEWCKGIDEDGYVRTGDDFDISELPAFIAACKWYREQLKSK